MCLYCGLESEKGYNFCSRKCELEMIRSLEIDSCQSLFLSETSLQIQDMLDEDSVLRLYTLIFNEEPCKDTEVSELYERILKFYKGEIEEVASFEIR